MNKRIRELALQSKLRPALLLHHWGEIDALTDSEQEELQQLDKFAELIVKECLDQLLIGDQDEDYDKGIYWSREQIKQHFGVEE